jgi:hypothetical protein
MSATQRPRAALRTLLVAALLVLPSANARAGDEEDGVYGRLAGDLDLRAHGGLAVLPGNTQVAVGASAHYLSTAGVYVLYTDAPGKTPSGISQSLSVGVDVCPLFLARFAKNLEHSSPFVDLLLDSVGFELGALWDSSRSAAWSVSKRPGVELAVTFAIPLMARAAGLYLAFRAGVRWNPWEMSQEVQPPEANHYAVLSVALGWRQFFRAHLVDVSDERAE